MKWLTNMTIGAKLIFSFIAVSAITAVVGWMGIDNMATINDMADDMYQRELMGLSHVKEANVNLLYITRAEKNMLLDSSKEDQQRRVDDIGKYKQRYLEELEKARALFKSDKAKELFSKLEKTWAEYDAKQDDVIALALKEGAQEQRESVTLSSSLRQMTNTIDELLTELSRLKEAGAQEASEETTRIYQASRTFMIGLVAGGVLVGMFLGMLITRSITRPLNTMRDVANQVMESAEQLNAASQNMASTSEEQSASVEEVTSSVEETDSQVKANTDAANAANQLVLGTSSAATEGQARMGEMVSAMNAISASAQNIAKIIKVIDEIAFQTNLLALNAAVEAARAGQHGRGFAVVAQEVRNLAGRSAKAARETAELIENSVRQVDTGVGVARQTSEAFDLIVGNIVKVKDLVAEIAAASTEQSRGVAQINVAINQVAKAAQEGSQQAEELASGATELTSAAERMIEEIRRAGVRDKAEGASRRRAEGRAPAKPVFAKAASAQGEHESAEVRTFAKGIRKSPKAVLPLDHDERGFGNF